MKIINYHYINVPVASLTPCLIGLWIQIIIVQAIFHHFFQQFCLESSEMDMIHSTKKSGNAQLHLKLDSLLYLAIYIYD